MSWRVWIPQYNAKIDIITAIFTNKFLVSDKMSQIKVFWEMGVYILNQWLLVITVIWDLWESRSELYRKPKIREKKSYKRRLWFYLAKKEWGQNE